MNNKKLNNEIKMLEEKYGVNFKVNDIILEEKVSEDFIENFKDTINWNDVCLFQKLSLDFIRRNKDYLNWPAVSFNQNITLDFALEFKDYIDWDWFLKRIFLIEEKLYPYSFALISGKLDDCNWVSDKYKEKIKNVIESKNN